MARELHKLNSWLLCSVRQLWCHLEHSPYSAQWPAPSTDTRCVTGNGRFWNGCYGADSGGRGLGRGAINLVRPCNFSCRYAAVDFRASCVWIRQFRKKWWIDYRNSAALTLPFHYRASWEHSKSQYHLEVGHILSNKGNDNEEETAWSCRNCTKPGERGKSERGHRAESNRSARRIRNERKRSKAYLTQNGV